MEDVKVKLEVKTEDIQPDFVDFTYDVNKIKLEVSLLDPIPQVDVAEPQVKSESTDITTGITHIKTEHFTLDNNFKSECTDRKFDVTTDAADFNPDPLQNEEFNIKSKIEYENPTNESTQMHFTTVEAYPCSEEKEQQLSSETSIKKSKRKKRLRQNIKTEDKPFKCTICDYKCKQNGHLRDHIRAHTGERPFQCNTCDKKFIYKSSLNLHIKMHTAERIFNCNLCSKKFKQNKHLKEHIRIHGINTSEKRFHYCDQCDSKYTRPSFLRHHMKIHTEKPKEKPLKCNLCDYRCTENWRLQRHVLFHTGEKPFQCYHCGANFSQKNFLQTHMIIHTGEKRFKCNVCDYKCLRSTGLRQHMLTHTDEKGFVCGICSSKFKRPGCLKKHMKLHTGA